MSQVCENGRNQAAQQQPFNLVTIWQYEKQNSLSESQQTQDVESMLV